MKTIALFVAAALALGACEAPSASDPEAEQSNAGEDATAAQGSEEGEQPRTRPDGAVDPIRVPEGT